MSAVLAALALLPDEERRVVVLHHLAGLSPEEVAARLARPPDVVHRQLARGTCALARLLQIR